MPRLPGVCMAPSAPRARARPDIRIVRATVVIQRAAALFRFVYALFKLFMDWLHLVGARFIPPCEKQRHPRRSLAGSLSHRAGYLGLVSSPLLTERPATSDGMQRAICGICW